MVTPDGPRGPRRKMSIGIVFLASHTGRAVIPTAYSCSRCWKIKGSWTDLVIPKPFAKVYLLGGRPVEVPAELEREELRQYATVIQTEMDRLNDEVEQLARGPIKALPLSASRFGFRPSGPRAPPLRTLRLGDSVIWPGVRGVFPFAWRATPRARHGLRSSCRRRYCH